ncbi:hypothetical protein KAI52_00600 [Candidatus Parcubacteria bacterium]|nr:hypothetical protein [Candidatus Parcubacteria bacterium]
MLDNTLKKSIFSKIYYLLIVGFFICLIIILWGTNANATILTEQLINDTLLTSGNQGAQEFSSDFTEILLKDIDSIEVYTKTNTTVIKSVILRAEYCSVPLVGLYCQAGNRVAVYSDTCISTDLYTKQKQKFYFTSDVATRLFQWNFYYSTSADCSNPAFAGSSTEFYGSASDVIAETENGNNSAQDSYFIIDDGQDDGFNPDQNFKWSDYMKINQFAPRDSWSESSEDNFRSLHDRYLFASGYAYETFLFPWSDPRILQASTTYETLFNFKPFPNSTTTDNVEWNKPWTWNDADTTIYETETALLKVYRAKNNYLCSTTTLQIDFDSVVNFGHPDDDSDLLYAIDLISFGEENLCPYASTTLHYETAFGYCDTTHYPLELTTEPAGYCRQYKAVYLWDGTGRWAYHNFTFLSVYDNLTDDLIVFEAPGDWIIDDDFIFEEPLGFWEKLLIKVTIGDSEQAQAYIAHRMDVIYNSLNSKFPSNYVAFVIEEVQNTIDAQATTTCFASMDLHFWGSGGNEVHGDTGEICLNVGIPDNRKTNFDIFLMLALFPIVFGAFYSLFSSNKEE